MLIKKKKIIKNYSKFNVLMICSLKKYKGVFEFIKIAKKLLTFKKINFTLVLNSNYKDIKNFFKYENLPKNIKIFSKQKKN